MPITIAPRGQPPVEGGRGQRGFYTGIKEVRLTQGVHQSIQEPLLETYYEQAKEQLDERKALLARIKEFEKRISHARDLVSSQQIDASDFREMKLVYTGSIEKPEAKLAACPFRRMSMGF